MRKLLSLVVIATTVAVWARGAEEAQFPERRVKQVGDIAIEYSAGDEAWAEALAQRAPTFRAPARPAEAAQRITVSDMERRREEMLALLTPVLGLKKPTQKMLESYKNFLEVSKMAEALAWETPRRYALWRRAEILGRLRAGENVENFKLEDGGGLSFSLNYQFERMGSDKIDVVVERTRQAQDSTAIPISIGDDATRTPDEEIEAGLVRASGMLSDLNASNSLRTRAPFFILHEVAEIAIVDHYIASRDRRWFCDGVANYVSWRTLEKGFGAEEARRFYDLEAQLEQFASKAEQIDLERWPAAEDLEETGYSEELNTANYAFSTKVIADICAKHGERILPKLFVEIGRTPKEKTDINTVYKAFKKLTREDLRDYLPKRPNT
jgi:hypothetical protein